MPGKTTLVQTTDQPVSSTDIMKSISDADPLFVIAPKVPDNQQQTFDSFCVDEERTKMEIQMPLKENPWDELSCLVLEYREDPEKGCKNVKKTTPEVRKPYMIPNPKPKGEVYEYSMYTYKIASQPAKPSNDERRWVFTGGAGKHDLGLVTNIFVPVEQLRLRLKGSSYERKIAYASDWTTYLECCRELGGLQKPNVPKEFVYDLNNLPPLKHAIKARIFEGAHLGLRNSIGEHASGSHFLEELFRPSKNDSIDDLSVFIFRRWCKVAYAACIAEPTAWSVKARFWTWPEELDDKVTFFYVMPEDMLSRVGKGNGIPAVTNKLGLKIGSKIKEDQIFDAWKAAITTAHKAAKKEVSDPDDDVKHEKVMSSPKAKIIKSLSLPKDYELLASHPQGFYKIYVSIEDLTAMKQCGYVHKEAYVFPILDDKLKAKNLDNEVATLKMTNPRAPMTRTVISTSTLAAAALWPRVETQNKVMYNTSANWAAQQLWDFPLLTIGSFEWLHRSAYSYGGIDGQGPDSSQVPQNMVLGTYEANTTMIRHEEYLKRLIKFRTSNHSQLFLFTTLEKETAWKDKTWSWLIKNLIYEWEFLLFEDLKYVVRTRHSFPVLSRQIPSRFEFDVDEQFDKLWMSKSLVPSTSFGKLMLLYLAGGADTNGLNWRQ